MLDITLFVGIAYAQIEAMLLGSTCNADIVIGNESVLEDFVLPVCISIPVAEVKKSSLFIGQLFIV